MGILDNAELTRRLIELEKRVENLEKARQKSRSQREGDTQVPAMERGKEPKK